MKVKFAAAAILLASTSIGYAADMAVKAPYIAPAAVWNWTGFISVAMLALVGAPPNRR